MKSKDILIAAVIVGVGYFFLSSKPLNAAQKRAALVQYAGASTDLKDLFMSKMTDSEIDATYTFIFDYVKKGRQLQSGSSLFLQIQAISAKYNIFT